MQGILTGFIYSIKDIPFCDQFLSPSIILRLIHIVVGISSLLLFIASGIIL